jgi:glycosyltransferase involved in cell wall biosynthesis
MPDELSQTHKPAVAMVAPSLGILGGQAVQARRLLDAWSAEGDVEVFLVPINPEPPGWLRPLTRIKYVRTAITQLIYWPSLVRAAATADVFHVFSASYFSFVLAPWPAVVVARLFGRPVLMNYRSGEAPDHLGRSTLARRTLRSAALNVVPSRFLQEVFAKHGIESRVIPNTIDRERFPFALRRPLRPQLLSTRNFEPLYNVACTLKAFAIVQRQHPDATLRLVGGGSQASSLRQLVADLGLRNVHFVGPVAPAEIWRHYAAADIYIQTPDVDNMPGSVLEAYASGLPVVSTDVGGVPAILTHETHGLLAPADDANAVATQVLRLLSDPVMAERLALAAYASTENLAWEKVRGQWKAAYRELLGYPLQDVPAVQES